MYCSYELALQRQAEDRATAAHRRMVREARSVSRDTEAHTLPAWMRRLRLATAHSRPAQA